MTPFSYEIHECNPETETLLVVYHIDGHPDIPMSVSMPPFSEWSDHDIEVRIWQSMGHVEGMIMNEQKAAQVKKRTAAECSHLIGVTFEDVFDPQSMLTRKPPGIPDFHPLTQELKQVGLSKTPDEAQYEVVELTPEESEKRTFSWRKDTYCSGAEIRKQLYAMGKLGEVEEAIKRAPREVEIDWNHAINFYRSGPIQKVIQETLGLSVDEVDAIWLAGEQVLRDRRHFGPAQEDV